MSATQQLPEIQERIEMFYRLTDNGMRPIVDPETGRQTIICSGCGVIGHCATNVVSWTCDRCTYGCHLCMSGAAQDHDAHGRGVCESCWESCEVGWSGQPPRTKVRGLEKN